MTYAAEHILLTCLFDSYSSAERGQFQLRASFPGAPAQPSTTLLGNVNTEFNNWFTGTTPYTNMGLCRLWRYIGCKVSWIDAAGLVKVNSTVQVATSSNPTGGESGAHADHWPPQTMLVATLLTAIPRGHGSHGRIFPPPSCTAIQSDGRASTGTRDNMATQVALLLTRLNAYSEIGSIQVMSKIGSGVSSNVTNVRVGLVVDTHRSRRRSLAETAFATSAVTP